MPEGKTQLCTELVRKQIQIETMISEIVKKLNDAKVILYPTDTVWGIGCDATNARAVQKIYQIKSREESKSLIILVDSFEMLQTYVPEVSAKIRQILDETKKPTTLIYNSPRGLARNTIAADDTIAIRIPKDDFCLEIIKKFGKPIVSSSANISGEPTPKCYSEISPAILDTVDYIVNLRQDEIASKSSTILRVNERDEIEVLRE
jgi:L-threonylcarbamoyladenylate synthase